jgi:PhnB protein
MAHAWKPEGYNSVSPYLVTRNAQEVIGFLRATLDAAELTRHAGEDGSIVHAEVRIDDTVVMIGEAGDGWPAAPCHLHVYVPDVDRTYARALSNGGDSVQEPLQKDDPDRRGGVRGPGGNTWWFGTRLPSS